MTHEQIKNDILANLKKNLRAKYDTWPIIAEKTGLSQKHIISIFTENADIKLTTLLKILQAVDENMYNIITDTLRKMEVKNKE